MPISGNKQYYVYIITKVVHSVLYTGVTSDLQRRVAEHKQKAIPGFASYYNINKLVYYEIVGSIESTIAREKQLKGGSRRKKIELIEGMNKKWKDLSLEW